MTSCTVLLILALGVIWDGKTDLLMFGLDRTEIRSPQNRAGFVSAPASTHLFEAETDRHPPLTNTTNEAVEIRKRSGVRSRLCRRRFSNQLFGMANLCEEIYKLWSVSACRLARTSSKKSLSFVSSVSVSLSEATAASALQPYPHSPLRPKASVTASWK